MMNEIDLLGTISNEVVSLTPIRDASSMEKSKDWLDIGHFSNPGLITGVNLAVFSGIVRLIESTNVIMTCWTAHVPTWSIITALLMLVFWHSEINSSILDPAVHMPAMISLQPSRVVIEGSCVNSHVLDILTRPGA